MYKISEQLAKHGFSVNSLQAIIERNHFSRQFSTYDFYCIFLTAEDLSFKVDNEPFEVKAGNAIFIGPQKLVELVTDTLGKEFYAIVFTASFYESNATDSQLLNSQIFFNTHSHIFTAPYFGNEEYNRVLLVDRLMEFSKISIDLFKAAAHNAIEALLIDAQLYVERSENNSKSSDTATSMFNKFKILLQRDFRLYKSVSHYAELLKISPRRLSDITEQISGKTAKEIIIEKIKFECMKSICHTHKTFSEIMYDLGFNDEANFTNFVKKHLGKKPSLLRNPEKVLTK